MLSPAIDGTGQRASPADRVPATVACTKNQSCQDELVDKRRGTQSYCDWCYGSLSAVSLEESARLGLGGEYSWACEGCLTSKAYRQAPEGWDDEEPWPFHDA